MTENELLRKIALATNKPKDLQDLQPSELAQLVLLVLEYIKNVHEAVQAGKIKGDPGATPIPNVDYLALPTARAELEQYRIDLTSKITSDVQKALSKLRNGRDGKDAQITEEHIKEAANLALEMIQLPDFQKYITEQPEAIRNSLELLQGDERLDINAIKDLQDTLDELRKSSRKLQSVGVSNKYLGQLLDVDLTGVTYTNGKYVLGSGTGTLADGDYGDVTVSSSGTVMTVDNGLAATKIANGSVSNTEFQYLDGVTSAIQTQIDNKVTKNSSITGATKTKITYDTKGLVTAGADATTDDITEGSNLYFTIERAQDAVGGALTDTSTIDFTYDDAGNAITADVKKQMSITSDASGLKLSGDASTPGNSKYYGTDSGGTKGYFDLPAGSSYTDENAQDAVGAMVSSAFTYNDVANTLSLTSRTIGGVAYDGTANITVASATGGFTVSGGDLAIGANNLTMTGSIGSTGSRVTKLWATDITVTNAISGSVTGNAGTATALASARTLWGQSFDGTGNITGSLTSVGDITGGASNMTITAGTGNSRTLILKTTTSGGTATTALTLGADQSATFAGTVALGANNLTMTGSLATTGARVTKGWFTDIESTNMPTVGGTAILTSLTAPQFTTIELGHASDTTLSRSSAGILAVEGVTVPLNSTTNTHTAQQIELGDASDTTISRASAGQVNIEGVQVATASNTLTFTNKSMSETQLTFSDVTTGDASTSKHGFLKKLDNTATHYMDGTGAWSTPAGPTCLTVIPASAIGADVNSSAGSIAKNVATNTTMIIGQIVVPYKITANKVSIGVTAAGTTGTLDITMYAEDGQSQIFSVTTASISAAGVVTTALSAVAINPGIYWIGINTNSTADITLYAWVVNAVAFGTGASNLVGNVTSEPVMQGTLTITAGTPPSTITPTSITNATNSTAIIRLDN